MKWLLICDKAKRILFTGPMYQGCVHDFRIFKELFTGMDFSALKVYVDLGFLGIKKVVKYIELFIPFKGSKKKPLNAEQIAINRQYSGVRIGVEHAIGRMKSYFILRIENRMRIIQKLNDAFQICGMLANFKM